LIIYLIIYYHVNGNSFFCFDSSAIKVLIQEFKKIDDTRLSKWQGKNKDLSS